MCSGKHDYCQSLHGDMQLQMNAENQRHVFKCLIQRKKGRSVAPEISVAFSYRSTVFSYPVPMQNTQPLPSRKNRMSAVGITHPKVNYTSEDILIDKLSDRLFDNERLPWNPTRPKALQNRAQKQTRYILTELEGLRPLNGAVDRRPLAGFETILKHILPMLEKARDAVFLYAYAHGRYIEPPWNSEALTWGDVLQQIQLMWLHTSRIDFH